MDLFCLVKDFFLIRQRGWGLGGGVGVVMNKLGGEDCYVLILI